MKMDRMYILHILECIRRIEEDTCHDRDAVTTSHTLQDAVLANLHTVSESTQPLLDRLMGTQLAVDW